MSQPNPYGTSSTGYTYGSGGYGPDQTAGDYFRQDAQREATYDQQLAGRQSAGGYGSTQQGYQQQGSGGQAPIDGLDWRRQNAAKMSGTESSQPSRASVASDHQERTKYRVTNGYSGSRSSGEGASSAGSLGETQQGTAGLKSSTNKIKKPKTRR